MKYFLIVLTVFLPLAGAGCVSSVTEPEQSAVNTEVESMPVVSLSGTTYTDAETGISFIQFDGWTVGIDEGGKRYTHSQKPYQTVTFEVFADRSDWEQKKQNITANLKADILIDSGQETIGGYPAAFDVHERRVGDKPLFQYARYFVDAGSAWYLISTSDPTDATKQIVASVQFGL